MALEEIELELDAVAVPEEIQRIIDTSDTCIDALFASGENKRSPKFIPSDPVLIYKALAFLTEKDLPLGRVFCEWGSGLGVATCIAAQQGYEAFGLETDASLAAASRRMAAELGLDVRILEASYVPEGLDSYSGMGGEYLIRDGGIADEAIYEGMDYEIAEIDVFCVYPWPLEQEFMQELFDAVAVEGAILISYHKAGEICAFQKMGERDEDL